MTNMQAAVGVAQLERLNDIVTKKIWILEQYQQLLKIVVLLTYIQITQSI